MEALWNGLTVPMMAALALGGLLLMPRNPRMVILGAITLIFVASVLGGLEPLLVILGAGLAISFALKRPYMLLLALFLALVTLFMPQWLTIAVALTVLAGLITYQW